MKSQFTKSLDAKFELTGEKGTIVAVSSSYGNEDVYGDVFERGAFAEDIARISKSNKLPMLFGHNPNQPPIGHWYKAWDDEKNLYTEGKLSLGVSLAKDIYENLKNGDLSGVSIGFNSDSIEERKDNKGNFIGRLFKKAKLLESSIVVFQANPQAGVDSVKSRYTRRELEKLLTDFARDAGLSLSRRDVEKMVRPLWDELEGTIERDADEAELLEAISAFNPLKI